MGRFYMDSQKEMGFPDEFGEDICQTGQDQPQPAGKPQSSLAAPFCGYVTLNWFGPFLLSPRTRGERGSC
jgi:hypothetical protein